MIDVILHGELAEAVGRAKWKFNVKTPGEALRAIETNTGKLFNYLMRDKGQAEYRVVIDDNDFNHTDQLVVPFKRYRKFEFIPVAKGAGSNGGWMIAIGVVLMIVAVALAIPTFGSSTYATYGGGMAGGLGALWGGAAPIYATATFGIGAAVALGGIAQLIAGSPSTEDNNKPENQPSYLFGGSINTIRQGNPVPICYGRVRAGSAVISASIRTIDIAAT